MRGKRNMVTSYSEDEFDLRRGPWTLEEDTLLIHYVSCHGEGRWNSLAKSSGLKRTGKSCRLRWLNYLKPDIKRGNITPQEQLLILELHSKWGNRWSKIAQHLPGRTDNEIKNYWRTRVQKQARHLKIDSNSKKFVDALRCFWMPRLLEKIEQSSSSSSSSSFCSTTSTIETQKSPFPLAQTLLPISPPSPHPLGKTGNTNLGNMIQESTIHSSLLQFQENSEYQTSPKENTTSTSAYYNNSLPNECYYVDVSTFDMMGSLSQPGMGSGDMSASGFQLAEADWMTDDMEATFWNMDELWQFRK